MDLTHCYSKNGFSQSLKTRKSNTFVVSTKIVYSKVKELFGKIRDLEKQAFDDLNIKEMKFDLPPYLTRELYV